MKIKTAEGTCSISSDRSMTSINGFRVMLATEAAPLFYLFIYLVLRLLALRPLLAYCASLG
jgi:hypothetical protein